MQLNKSLDGLKAAHIAYWYQFCYCNLPVWRNKHTVEISLRASLMNLCHYSTVLPTKSEMKIQHTLLHLCLSGETGFLHLSWQWILIFVHWLQSVKILFLYTHCFQVKKLFFTCSFRGHISGSTSCRSGSSYSCCSSRSSHTSHSSSLYLPHIHGSCTSQSLRSCYSSITPTVPVAPTASIHPAAPILLYSSAFPPPVPTKAPIHPSALLSQVVPPTALLPSAAVLLSFVTPPYHRFHISHSSKYRRYCPTCWVRIHIWL